MFKPNHLHLLVKGKFKNPPTKVDDLNNWLTELITKVRMVITAGPISARVEDPGNTGLTGLVGIATSHASIHIWEEDDPSMFQFDLYSCTEFSPREVLDHLRIFDLYDFTYMLIDRNGESMKILDLSRPMSLKNYK